MTLIRHGLAEPARGVFKTIDLEGDNASLVYSLGSRRRFCLLGELDVRGLEDLIGELLRGLRLLSVMDAFRGSGDESGEKMLV